MAGAGPQVRIATGASTVRPVASGGHRQLNGYPSRKLLLNLPLSLTGGSRKLAYLLIPRGTGPFPVVAFVHDRGAVRIVVWRLIDGERGVGKDWFVGESSWPLRFMDGPLRSNWDLTRYLLGDPWTGAPARSVGRSAMGRGA